MVAGIKDMDGFRRRRWRKRTRRGDDEAGAAAVEFALIFPLLIILVFGIIAFGVLFAQQLALGNSARQGARYGVVANRTCDEIRVHTRDASTTIGMDSTAVDVVVTVGTTEGSTNLCPTGVDSLQPCAGTTPGDNLYVRANYTSELMIPLVVVDNSFEISGLGAFRCEFS